MSLIICLFFISLAITYIYTLTLHDALPICEELARGIWEIYNETPIRQGRKFFNYGKTLDTVRREASTFLDCSVKCRSEEHTSELQSRVDLVFRLLLEKKKNYHNLSIEL